MTFTSGAGSSAIINPGAFINNGGINLTEAVPPRSTARTSRSRRSTRSPSAPRDASRITDFGKVHFTGPTARDMSGTISVSAPAASIWTRRPSPSPTIPARVWFPGLDREQAEVNDDYKGTILFLDATGTSGLRISLGPTSGTIAGLSNPAPGVRASSIYSTPMLSPASVLCRQRSGRHADLLDNTTTLATLRLDWGLHTFGVQLRRQTAPAPERTSLSAASPPERGSRRRRARWRWENLRASQTVVTAEGDVTPSSWLGHRHIDCRHYPEPRHVWPVRIRAGRLASLFRGEICGSRPITRVWSKTC